jgi:hypothetical protein
MLILTSHNSCRSCFRAVVNQMCLSLNLSFIKNEFLKIQRSAHRALDCIKCQRIKLGILYKISYIIQGAVNTWCYKYIPSLIHTIAVSNEATYFDELSPFVCVYVPSGTSRLYTVCTSYRANKLINYNKKHSKFGKSYILL